MFCNDRLGSQPIADVFQFELDLIDSMLPQNTDVIIIQIFDEYKVLAFVEK